MVLIGSVTLGQAGPCMEALASARGVAYTVFNIIDRVSSKFRNEQPVLLNIPFSNHIELFLAELTSKNS